MNPVQTSQEDCSSAAAVYVVTETGGSDVTCSPGEASYTEGTSTIVCLRYNLTVGQCAQLTDGIIVTKKVDCLAPGSTTAMKLTALLTDSADESECPAGATITRALVKRNRLYCFAPIS